MGLGTGKCASTHETSILMLDYRRLAKVFVADVSLQQSWEVDVDMAVGDNREMSAAGGCRPSSAHSGRLFRNADCRALSRTIYSPESDPSVSCGNN